jgi:L,D-transpeptidase catalytic domain
MEDTMRVAPLTFAALAALLAFDIPEATGDVLITVRKSDQQMMAEVDGIERWVWPVSTGRLNHDTPGGTFNAIWMDANHVSRELFLCSGSHLHASTELQSVPNPGNPFD